MYELSTPAVIVKEAKLFGFASTALGPLIPLHKTHNKPGSTFIACVLGCKQVLTVLVTITLIAALEILLQSDKPFTAST
ncbi:hypothetical protein FLA105534_00500 [Flavobacterium bizetiae]|uniref:Uncharacterized protein n=1 Tax=Flavobacterium bizetiae TaxID=2704140 RepID=A0A6J4G7X0_9FLAO|nr:hypothetical protein FLA105534_00500 [Flavobacterium bizetiae]CAD5344188.1 hypothetical protein FLA105535_04194 [Flavobacterium bizetiae]